MHKTYLYYNIISFVNALNSVLNIYHIPRALYTGVKISDQNLVRREKKGAGGDRMRGVLMGKESERKERARV